MASRTLKTGLLAAALALLGYWYWSPYLTIRAMQTAAEQRDADTFNTYIDYPKVRESLKDQFSDAVADNLEAPARRHGGLAQAGAALGAMLGMAVADHVVDALVRPQYLMRAMQEGVFNTKRRRSRDADPVPNDDGSQPPEETRRKITWHHERQGFNRLIAYPERADGTQDKQVGLVMERSGFADWKLTAIRLPPQHSR